jgi:hypothetical protein
VKSLTAIVVCFLVCLMVGGCGGAGSPLIPQTGNFSGTWQSVALADSGAMTLAVQGNGQTTGTMTDTGTGQIDGLITATMLADGTFNGTVQFGSDNALILSGKLNLNGNGHLAGTITEFKIGNGFAITVDLAP